MTLGKSFLSFNLLYPSSFPLLRLFLGSTYQAAVTQDFFIHIPSTYPCASRTFDVHGLIVSDALDGSGHRAVAGIWSC